MPVIGGRHALDMTAQCKYWREASSFSPIAMASPKYTIQLDPSKQLSPLAENSNATLPVKLPNAKLHHTHASFPMDTQAIDDPKKISIYFVGTVRLIIRAEIAAG